MKNISIKKNYFYNLAYQILVIISPLITTPYLSRVLQPEGIGIYSFTNSIVSYFILFATMGLSIYGQREISYVQNDKIKRSKIFWEIKILTIINVFICLLIYLILTVLYVDNQYLLIYLIWGISIFNVAVDVTWFFQGLEEFKKIVTRNFFIKILDIMYIFIFVKDKDDLIIYILGIVIFQVLGNAILWISLPKYIVIPKVKNIKPLRNIKEIISLFIPALAIQLYLVLDKIMLGCFSDSFIENGYYEQAMKISKLVLTIVISLGTVMVPRIGFLFGQKQYEKVIEYMYKSYKFVCFLGIPLCVGLISISDNLVPWFFGIDYMKVSDILKISSVLIIFIGISNVTGLQYLIPTKRQRIFTYTVILGAIINIISNIIFIPKFYAMGAAISSAIAEGTIMVVQLIAIRREIKFKMIIKNAINYIVASFIMGLVLYIEGIYIVSSMINTFIMILSGIFVYAILLVLLKDKFFINNIRKINM